MNPNEIKKALECCTASISDVCDECPVDKKLRDDCVCGNHLMKHALAYINQLETEVERLNTENLQMIASIKHLRANEIKEFWSRIQNIAYQSSDWSHGEHPMVIELDKAKDIYTEMVGDEK